MRREIWKLKSRKFVQIQWMSKLEVMQELPQNSVCGGLFQIPIFDLQKWSVDRFDPDTFIDTAVNSFRLRTFGDNIRHP